MQFWNLSLFYGYFKLFLHFKRVPGPVCPHFFGGKFRQFQINFTDLKCVPGQGELSLSLPASLQCDININARISSIKSLEEPLGAVRQATIPHLVDNEREREREASDAIGWWRRRRRFKSQPGKRIYAVFLVANIFFLHLLWFSTVVDFPFAGLFLWYGMQKKNPLQSEFRLFQFLVSPKLFTTV